MTLLQSILLGIIQGLTEFLPISSSAHLALTPYLLGWQIPQEEAFTFDILVQVASLAAVIAYFWQDLTTILRAVLFGIRRKEPFKEPAARLGWLLILATLPAGMIGIFIKDLVEKAFASPVAVASFLLVTAALLPGAEYLSRQRREIETLNWKDALWIGLAQAFAVFPGISRSGATISGALACGLKRPAAARFAFLMSIPVMLAAGLFASLDLLSAPEVAKLFPVFIPGLLASALVSYLSIRWLLRYVARRSLYIFALYCATLGLLVLAISLFR